MGPGAKFFTFNQLPLYTDDFYLRGLTNATDKDAIVLFNPADAIIVSPALLRSRKTLQEHIEYIQKNDVRKAIVAAEDIRFLLQCPSLECLWILPAVTAESFDYSPLYDMPNLTWLRCETVYGAKEEKSTHVDYSRFPMLRTLSVGGGKGHENVRLARNVATLSCWEGYPQADDLSGQLPGDALECLSLCQSRIRSLNGLGDCLRIRRLELSCLRNLTDITALRALADSLVYLEIEACGKIRDFSVLSELHNLEFLILKGSNVLPDLHFLQSLPRLKHLHLTMDVADGDLRPCLLLPYVRIQNRRHFSHSDKEMPKNYVNPDTVIPFGRS